MIIKMLAYYLNLHPDDMAALLQMSPHELYEDSLYGDLVNRLDIDYLYDTLPYAKVVLDAGLPALVARLAAENNLYHFPLDSYMLGNWIIGFLQYPSEMWRLREKHNGVAQQLFHEVIPEVLAMFEALGDASPAWQQAFATMVIPLVACGKTQLA